MKTSLSHWETDHPIRMGQEKEKNLISFFPLSLRSTPQ